MGTIPLVSTIPTFAPPPTWVAPAPAPSPDFALVAPPPSEKNTAKLILLNHSDGDFTPHFVTTTTVTLKNVVLTSDL